MNTIPSPYLQSPKSEPPATSKKPSPLRTLRVWGRFTAHVVQHLFKKVIQSLPGAAPQKTAIEKRSIEHLTSGGDRDKVFTLLKASKLERNGEFMEAAWLRSQASEGIYEPSTSAWQFFRVLGSGGEGQANQVFDGSAGELKVKKSFYRSDRNHPNLEMKLLGHLDHPSIIKITPNEQNFHITRHAGAPLTALVPRYKASPPRHLFQSIARQLADSLAYLKEEKVQHRDIKPDNIVIDPAGHITLIDFGSAYDGNTGTPCNPYGVGTDRYMPPDTLNYRKNGLKYSDTADVFSAGQTLFELLTDRLIRFPAFRQLDDESEADAWNRYKQDPASLAPLDTIGPRLTRVLKDEKPKYIDGLTDLLKQMLHPDPNHRITPEQLKKHPVITGKGLDLDQ